MSKIIIPWEYGIALLNNYKLIYDLKRFRKELKQFNWDYMIRPSIYEKDKMVKITDFDAISDRYEWLTAVIPELEKMCRERGIDFSETEC